jgi:hypothetical protein
MADYNPFEPNAGGGSADTGNLGEAMVAAPQVLDRLYQMYDASQKNFTKESWAALEAEAAKYGLTYQDLLPTNRTGLSRQQREQAIIARMRAGSVQAPQTRASPQAGAAEQPNENDVRRERINAQLQAFADELGRGVDMSDPVFAGLIRAGQAEAGARINQTGVRGGLADLTTAEAAQRTSLPYLAQRQGMRQQALGMIANRDMGLEQLDQGWAGLNMQAQQMNNQNAMQQWAQGKNNNQAMGSMVGGGVGLLGGLVATAATGGAAAPLIPALVSGGSALGAGGFGMTSPTYSPQPYSINRRPSSFSGY